MPTTIKTKPTTPEYASNWDRIFGNAAATPANSKDGPSQEGAAGSVAASDATRNRIMAQIKDIDAWIEQLEDKKFGLLAELTNL